MTDFREAVTDFLSQECIAVVGVSRNKGGSANSIYRKLRSAGYRVFPVNYKAGEVEGDKCYSNLAAIPGRVGSVVIATKPDATVQIVHQCAELGISRVWMHRSLEAFGTSVSGEALEFCRANNITAIPGGCPMMFCEPVDFPHKCLRWYLMRTGRLPKDG